MSAAAQRLGSSVLLLLLGSAVAGCALYSEVSVSPLVIVPTKIERGADIQAMLRKSDYLRAMEMAPTIETRPRQSAAELVALAQAEVASVRFDAARRHLRMAIALSPPRNVHAEASWLMSQADYMSNNIATALDWAETAAGSGLLIMQWHMDYLRALRDVPLYQFSGAARDVLDMRMGRPDVPRIDVRINDTPQAVEGIIDSGAVLSIMSERLAQRLSPRQLDVSTGTFYGLLGEPIPVRFAILDTLHLGLITVANVPVAIMPDEKMRFFIGGKREFSMDFLLGANLLKEFRLEFDFARDRLTLTRLTSLDRRPAEDQNLFFENFRPVVRGTIQKRGWFAFVLDTGSEVTYLNESQVGALPIDFFAPRIHTATLQGLGGARKSGAKVEDVEIGIDKWAGTFKTLPMYTGSEKDRTVGIIGQNFLKRFHVVIDFGRMRVDLQRR